MAIRSIIIKPGEKILLPAGTKIESIVTNGGILVDSTCDNLPAPTVRKCYKFVYELGGGDTFRGIQLGDTYYDSPVNTNLFSYFADNFPAMSNLSDLVTVYCQGVVDSQPQGHFWMAVPEAFGIPELKVNKQIGDPDFDFPFYIKGVADDQCPDCNNNI